MLNWVGVKFRMTFGETKVMNIEKIVFDPITWYLCQFVGVSSKEIYLRKILFCPFLVEKKMLIELDRHFAWDF